MSQNTVLAEPCRGRDGIIQVGKDPRMMEASLGQGSGSGTIPLWGLCRARSIQICPTRSFLSVLPSSAPKNIPLGIFHLC